MIPLTNAFFFDPFNQFQQQQQPQQKQFDYQSEQLNNDCNKYLCPETFHCVDKPLDCPCPFPDSQLKCTLPDKSNFVCISKSEKKEGVEVRDCEWVNNAWKGLV